MLGNTPVKSAKLDTSGAIPGKKAYLVGLRGDRRRGAVLSSALGRLNPKCQPPGFVPQAMNFDGISLVGIGGGILDGVLADASGNVLAFHGSFGSSSKQSKLVTFLPLCSVGHAQQMCSWEYLLASFKRLSNPYKRVSSRR